MPTIETQAHPLDAPAHPAAAGDHGEQPDLVAALPPVSAAPPGDGPARSRGGQARMSWAALIAAIACDVAATFALAASHGFRHPLPSALAVAGLLATTYLFGMALTGLGPGVSYAAFGALGTTAVAVIGFASGGEQASWAKAGALALIVAGVVLLPVAERH